jgi:DNA-binding transcriptional LysR family regulator
MPAPDAVVATAHVPRWETAFAMVAQSDAIATGPRWLAERQAERLGLQVLEPPERAPGWSVSMVRRVGEDAGLAWFRGEVRAAAA